MIPQRKPQLAAEIFEFETELSALKLEQGLSLNKYKGFRLQSNHSIVEAAKELEKVILQSAERIATEDEQRYWMYVEHQT
jgi:hypothetical protein